MGNSICKNTTFEILSLNIYCHPIYMLQRGKYYKIK